jgi:hypothetical protein
MTDDIDTPEILATVGHFDYITGVLKRPHDGGPARFYSSIEAWETTEAAQLAAMWRANADMRRDRDAAEKKVGELILRNQAQERTIDRLQRQLLEAQANHAPLDASPAAPTLPTPPESALGESAQLPADWVPPTLPRHQKIPCGVDGCLSLMAVGPPMAAHRMRKHKTWHDAQMLLGHDLATRGLALADIPAAAPRAEPPEPEEPEELEAKPLPVPIMQVAPPPREPGPPTPDAPATPDVVREHQRQMLEKQFASLTPFVCSACQKSIHMQSLTDPSRCQRCTSEGRYADDAIIAVRT